MGGSSILERLPLAEVNSDDKVLEPGLSSTLKERLGVIGSKGIFTARLEEEWLSRWWFQIFFIFTPTWGRFPFPLIFFRWVETTN